MIRRPLDAAGVCPTDVRRLADVAVGDANRRSRLPHPRSGPARTGGPTGAPDWQHHVCVFRYTVLVCDGCLSKSHAVLRQAEVSRDIGTGVEEILQSMQAGELVGRVYNPSASYIPVCLLGVCNRARLTITGLTLDLVESDASVAGRLALRDCRAEQPRAQHGPRRGTFMASHSPARSGC